MRPARQIVERLCESPALAVQADSDDLLGLTPAQFELFRRGCHSTLDAIAGDAFSGKTVPRKTVVEITLDSDHLLHYGGRGQEWKQLYRAVIDPLIQKHYGTPAFDKLMKKVFPYERYGM